MSLLKQLDRAARTCWCPSARFPTLLASGTIAGTIDDSFVTKSQLEIYDIDLANPSSDLRLVGSIESKDCFHSVAWGSKGMDDGMNHGVVAGGMSDGSINIWNVDSILSRSPDALLSRSEVHKGQVLGLQFHPSQPNLLASGATDGEVYVWDLANLKAPVPNKPNPASKAAQLSGITSIAWNRNAPQILASASEVGETTVWDLRQKRSIITIRNSARQNVRTAAITWNPSASVQLAVSYNNYPVAEIWDLRQSMAPKVKLEGFHSNSILSLDWCPNDSNVLLTVGEDARMAAWNPNTGAFLHEYGTHNVAFDVQWSPKLPNLISTSSYDGKVNVLSIDTTGPSHVPSWMTRPIGATFGFGGKLTSFGFDVPAPPAAAVAGAPAPQKVPFHPRIQLQQLVTDPEVLDKAQGLQQILKQGDYPGFCNYKITNSAGDDDEKTIWTFMKILFEDEANQRFLLLKELGFEPPVGSDIVPPTPAQPAPAAAAPEPVAPAAPQMSEDEFFNQDFKAPEEDHSALDSTASALGEAINGIDGKEPETPAAAAAAAPVAGPFVEDADDRAIRQALVFGDFKAAVARCLASNRMADAIVFASFGPSTLWEETRAAYFAQHKMPFIRNIMKNVSNQSLEEMIQQSELNNWKETLAICITYTTAQKYRQVVNQLAQRLEESNMNIPAVVCYICSSNIDKAIDMWTSKIPAHISGGEGGSALLSLHAAIEKIAVFAHATNAHGAAQAPSKTLSLKYAEYAAMLASQGELRGAFNYLSRVATPNDPNSSVLLDRIFHAESEQFVREHYPMPAFPFPVEIVQPDPTLAQNLHQQAIAKQQRDQMRAQQAQQQAAMNQNRQPTGNFAPSHAAPAQQPRAGAPYGAPNQPYGNAPANVGYGNAYGNPNQPNPGYGAPNAGYGAPAPAAQPRTFQPAAPAYSTPAQPNPSAYGAPGGYGNPSQPNTGYGAPASHQPSYGAPAANNFNAPAPAQPPRQAQPAAAPYAPAPAQPSFNQPYAPAAAAPAPVPFVPASQPAVFQPPAPAYATPAPAPAAVPAPVAAAPKPFVPAQPAAAMVPSSAPAAAAAAPAAEAPVVLSPADQALINPLEQCLNQLTAVGLKAPEQKKVTEIRGKLQELAKKLSQHELSATALPELQALCNAVASNDFTSAQKHHLNLVKTDWANNNEWLLGLKTMLLMAKKYLEKSG